MTLYAWVICDVNGDAHVLTHRNLAGGVVAAWSRRAFLMTGCCFCLYEHRLSLSPSLSLCSSDRHTDRQIHPQPPTHPPTHTHTHARAHTHTQTHTHTHIHTCHVPDLHLQRTECSSQARQVAALSKTL